MSKRLLQTIYEYTVTKVLSSSPFCSVYLCTRLSSSYVIKKYGCENSLIAQREYEALTNFKHKNIVKCIEFKKKVRHSFPDGQFENCCIFVMEYASNGDLMKLLENRNGLSQQHVHKLFKMMVEALEIVHESGYAHLDLKPENLLFDRNFNLKLADFGFATKSNSLNERVVGSASYMAPEILENRCTKPKKADIFSCGVVLFMMATSLKPFSKADKSDVDFEILCNDKTEFWEFYNDYNIDSGLKNLIQNMLESNHERRVDIDQIKNSKWYNKRFQCHRPLSELFT